jgi:hypothetical protein
MKKIIVYYFIFLFSFFSVFSAGVLDSIDGLQYLAVARNIYYKGDPTAPVYEYNTRENLHLSSFVAENGKTYSMTGLGFSLAFLPAVFITDLVYRIYNASPPAHFPLESDWLILFLASFTNSFFGAALGVIMFLYFKLLKLSVRQSLFLSLLSIIGTNLFVYTKHSFAHMAFIVFMMLTFLLIRYYGAGKDSKILFLAGVSFGALSIVYNQTFLLTLIPIIVFYVFAVKPQIKTLPKEIKRLLYFFAGLLPFIFVYFWYENLRSLPEQNFAGVQFYATYAVHTVSFPITVFIEGLHGQLFSPGRSIFLYSPVLLIIIFFWIKIKGALKPELLAFLLMSLIYVIFYALQYRVGAPDQGIVGNWHGELSWGPRYLTPLIPLGMLLVGAIYINLSKKLKLSVFYPLVAAGFLIQLLGIVMPYQIKLHEMEHKIYLNGTEYFSSLYSDFMPRYNPILNMAKKLNKLRQNFPRYLDNGPYNLRFYDGIDFSFPVGNERWRVIENKGYISFENSEANPVREVAIGLINHPIEISSESAQLKFSVNGRAIAENTLDVAEREIIKIPIPGEYLVPGTNDFSVEASYKTPMEIKFPLNPNVTTGRKQILGLLSFDINGQRQNLESVDVPFVSSLGPPMTGVVYRNWGGDNRDPWKVWDIHTQTFERLPDFWWIRNLFYWDIPKTLIISLFILNICLIVFSGFMVFKNLKKV